MLEQIRIVLIRPTHPGNIGAAARAMKTMGLSDLRLVGPSGFPSYEATAMASGADDVLAQATVLDSLEEALAGCPLVLGTTARLRSLPMDTVDPRHAAAQAVAEAARYPVALVFGRERSGLSNEELARCQQLVHVPANPDYSSLNLAASVQILAYELRMAALAEAGPAVPVPEHEPAPVDELERFHEHLHRTLLEIEFLDPRQSRKMMLRLWRLFNRARPDQNEINILRGILSAAQLTHRRR